MAQRTGLALLGGMSLAFILLAYFIPLIVEEGDNYLVHDTLLGMLIFHNLWLLALYIIIGIALIWFGLRIRIRIQ